MSRPLGVILAGGQSRRMGGGDKAFRMLAGQSLLSHVISRLSPQVESLAINANGDAARFAEYRLPVIADSVAGFAGPLAGVLAGLDWAASLGADHILTAAADTPFFPLDLGQRLERAALEADTSLALAATPDPVKGVSRHPTFGLWPVALRHDLRQALSDGTRKIVVWTDRHNGATAVFQPVPFDGFFNVNTPEDMDRAKALLQEHFN